MFDIVRFAIRFFVGIIFIIMSPFFFILSYGFEGWDGAKDTIKDIFTMGWMEQI